MITIATRCGAARGPRRICCILGLGTAGLLLLAGCGATSSSAQGSGSQSSAPGSSGGGRAGTRSGAGRGPGVFGRIAQISGKTMQVQGQSEQTAVTWTGRTKFSQQKSAGAGAVVAGSCVTVRSAATTQGTGGAAGPGAVPPVISAASVTVVPVGNGGCHSGFGGFGGGAGRGGSGRPSGAPGGAPTGMPNGAPPAAPDGSSRTGIRPVTGTVTAVHGNAFTVAAQTVSSAGPSASGASTAPTRQTTDVTVQTTSATTYTTRVAVSASAAKVGQCVAAQGRTDDTGAMSANTIMLSSPIDGSCTQGLRGRGGAPRG